MRVARGFGGLLAASVFALGAPPASAELGWFGVHGAYYNEFEKGAIGLNARETFGASPITVGFKADYLFRPRRTSWVFEVDLQYELAITERTLVWAGGGGGVLHDDPNGPLRADFDPIASAFVGVGVRRGPLMPYAEVRLQSHETARWVCYLGLRF